jgi:hypothetical protein
VFWLLSEGGMAINFIDSRDADHQIGSALRISPADQLRRDADHQIGSALRISPADKPCG